MPSRSTGNLLLEGLTPRVVIALDRLVATGLYGHTIEDAATRLIDAGLRRAIRYGMIER